MIQHRIKEREPQYMDMKEIIAEAARKHLLDFEINTIPEKGKGVESNNGKEA